MIRILQIVGTMHPGGMENFIMNLYEKIDREKFQFDFVVHLKKENDHTEQIKKLGGKIYEIPRLTKDPIGSLSLLYKIVKKNKYQIVIRHTANALVAPQLLVAKIAGAKTICHSHNETDPQATLHKIGKVLMKFVVDKRLACSKKAGIWMFDKKEFRVINNAINVNKFAYSEEKAEKIRQEFGLQGKHIYGHIANFRESKNHMFLLEVYKEIAQIDEKAIFFCLGEGELRAEIEHKIKELHLEERVILTGIRNDVENFMSCMDVLIFPSFFEGLPLTLIEAQIAALPAIISDTITQEVIVTEGLVTMSSIEESPESWAKKAVQLLKDGKTKVRQCQHKAIRNAGYDMDVLVKWYEDYFTELIR